MDSSCPYNAQPSFARWKDAISRINPSAVDLSTESFFAVGPDTRIASAGSCFAQHIRNRLVKKGYRYLVTEEPPIGLSDIDREDKNYGVFPARFGNIYTTVQLLQLFDRAFGYFEPSEDYWLHDGCYFDPYRPSVEPGGFANLELLRQDRDRHLQATRKMFEQVDVFIFTLGLTESWRSRVDGAVFPLCPGCPIGTFDATRHEFVNLGVAPATKALGEFVDKLSAVNPAARIVLTVSPVPLAATMTKDHILKATTYSKSVLRVAAQEIESAYSHVSYFPSYEIIMSTGMAHEYFAGDRRTVLPKGVDRVMDLFFKQFCGSDATAEPTETVSTANLEVPDRVLCDEDTLVRLLDQTKRG